LFLALQLAQVAICDVKMWLPVSDCTWCRTAWER